MSVRKSKLALELEGSDLYNRRKNVSAPAEDFDEAKPGDNVASSQHLRPPDLPFIPGDSRGVHNLSTSPVYALPYATPGSTFSSCNVAHNATTVLQPEHVNPVPKPPRSHDPVADSHDPKDDLSSKRITTMDTPELEAEFMKQFTENVDINEAMNERPPSFPPPEK